MDIFDIFGILASTTIHRYGFLSDIAEKKSLVIGTKLSQRTRFPGLEQTSPGRLPISY